MCLVHDDTAVDTKVWAIPSSNCAAHFILAECWIVRGLCRKVVCVTQTTISD